MNQTPDKKQEQMERKAKHCIHFNGMFRNKTCDAGIAYASLPKENPSFKSFICFGEAEGCPKYQAMGMEAVVKLYDESEVSLNRTNLARKAIVAASEGKRGVRGAIACPVCSTGSLHYSIANYNGHIHAQCSTTGCVAWME